MVAMKNVRQQSKSFMSICATQRPVPEEPEPDAL